MRAWGKGTVGRALAAVAATAAVVLGVPMPAMAAPGPLTITPIGWNVVGLDHNDVTDGPDSFPVGGRVCNTGSDSVTNLTVDWVWDSADTYINLTGFSQYTQASLAAGACRDVYFNVQVTRNAAAYDNSRDFHITADADVVSAVSTPTPREIYVEHLVSQNRNEVNSWTLSNTAGCDPATGVVYIGSTCTATIVSKTATGGYEQLVNAYYFNNSIFRIESLSSTYSVPSGHVNTQMYADACGWENNPSDPDYLSCLDTDPIPGGKAGGNPITTVVNFTVIGTGAQTLTGIIYDYSGSSFHYNSDSGVSPNLLSLTATHAPTAPDTSPDSETTNEDNFVDVDVLANDTDINNDMNPSSLSIASQPANGTATVVGGEARYTPDPDFTGVDSFTYQVCDTTSPTPLCSTETVTITVNPLNDVPTAQDDAASTSEDTDVDVDVLANDSDVDGDGLSIGSFTQPANGTVTDNGDGTLNYQPNADFYGIDTFTYTVSDGNGGFDTATVTITVNSVNDDPVADDDAASTNEDTDVDIDVLVGDSDPEGDALSIDSFTQPANGTVTDNGDGTLNYQPNADFNGIDTFTYTISDGNGGFDTATVTITVNAVNDGPVADDDSASTNEDTDTVIDVLTNDADVDGDGLSIDSFTQAANGTVIDNGDGTFTYTPSAGFHGVDTFTYTISDGNGGSDTATVTITVSAVNDGPVADDDFDSTNEDVDVDVDVLPNDSDADGDALSIDSFTQAANGTVTDNGDGTLNYQPDADFNGIDTFTYMISDGNGGSDTATVTVTVSAVADPPSAVADAVSVNEDDVVSFDVTANDTDPDGDLDPSTTQVLTSPTSGSLVNNGDGTFDYTPDADFSGTDTFIYQVCDLLANCDAAVVTITVDPVNDAPSAVDDVELVDQDQPTTIDVLANDEDNDGDVLDVSILTGPTNGTALVNVDGTITYTPDAGYTGPDSFTYQICDPSLVCDTATVTITVADLPEPPVANDDADSLDEDSGSVVVDVVANDTDPEGDIDPASVLVTIGAANGTAVSNGDGTVTYTPDADINGTDTFTYEVCDVTANCVTAEVTITVNPVDDAPQAIDDAATVDEDSGPIVIDVAANDIDVDGDLDPTTVSVVSGPSNGTLTNNGDGTFGYEPDPDFSGSDSFTYEVCDLSGACAQADVNITVNEVNDPPTAIDDSETTDEDVAVDIDVLSNDNDPDDGLDPASVSVVAPAGDGSTNVNPDGSITYTPDADFAGADSFTYEVCDFAGLCTTAVVDVVVDPVNDPPTALDDLVVVDEDAGPVTIDVLSNDSDPEGGALTVTSAGPAANGTVTVNGDGTIGYQPDPDFSGSDSFTYEVCDPSNDCTTATATVTVNPFNDPPVAGNDSDSTNEDTSVDIDVLANDTDADGDTLTVDSFANGSHGTVTLNGDGTLRYTPDPDWFGTDTFDYVVCDPTLLCDTATVTVDVTSINDPPVAGDDADSAVWGIPLDIAVDANDSDPDGLLDLGTLTVASGPSNGTANANNDGTITYIGADGFVGVDTFTYEICDDGTPVECTTAEVTVTVAANAGPDASDDIATVDEDSGPVTIDVLANDSDPDGGSLTVTSAGPAGNGTVTVNPGGTVDYEPDPDFYGTDTFTYTVCDSNAVCSTATVTVDVNPVNDAPNAVDDVETVEQGDTVNVDVMDNDSDSDGTIDSSTVNVQSQPLHGVANVNGNGSIDYTADGGYAGADSFTYEVCDNDGLCDVATVDIVVTSTGNNNPPVAAPDSRTTDEDTHITIGVRNNDSDPDGDALSLGAISSPSHGTAQQSGGRIRYVPDTDWFGTDSFTYEVCDPDGACDLTTVTVVVLPVNDAPVAHDDVVTTKPGKPVEIPVKGNDEEHDGDPVSVTVVDQPSHGTVTVNATGDVVYTPDANYSGSDTFTYQICDPDGECSTATVTVEVSGGSSPPAEPREPREPNESNEPDPAPQPGALPRTGGDLLRLGLWSITLLAAGLTLMAGGFVRYPRRLT